MMPPRCYCSVLGFFAVFELLMFSTSCRMVEERIERTVPMLKVPAETAVYLSSESTDQPKEIAARSAQSETLKVTITEAILLCLENNRSLVLERLNPSIRQTFEDQENAVFDPSVNAYLSAGRVKAQRLARSGSETEDFTADTAEGIISL